MATHHVGYKASRLAVNDVPSKSFKVFTNELIALSSNKKSDWYDMSEYDFLAGTLKKSAALNGKLTVIWSNDKVAEDFYEQVVAQATSITGGFNTPKKAKYFRVLFENTDATTGNTVNVSVTQKKVG